MLVEELLSEAKSVQDFRHANIEKDLPYWGGKTSGWIDPKEGFHFMFDKGELTLASTDNATYSAVVATGRAEEQKKIHKGLVDGLPKVPWNVLGGVVDLSAKTVTIAKESVGNGMRQRSIYDIKNFQNALKNLRKFGVTNDFKIKGVPSPMNGAKVKDILEMSSHVDNALGRDGQVMYHGTSASKAAIIEKQGLRPGQTEGVYADLIAGYSEYNVYLAVDIKTAEFYGKRQAKKDGDDQYVIFKIEVPDAAKILPDDSAAGNMKKGQEGWRIKSGIKDSGAVAYKGAIKPQFISIQATRKA